MDGPLLIIDRSAARTVVPRLVESLRRGILDGRLRAGDRVPSTWVLAGELGIARSSVVAAYEQLAGEGYLELRQGAATRFARLPRDSATTTTTATATKTPASTRPAEARRSDRPPSSERAGTSATSAAASPIVDLSPGIPSTARLDVRAWRAAWRAAAAPPPGLAPPSAGLPELRAAIAEHLRNARGVDCAADDVIVTAGTSEALAVVAHALRAMLERAPLVGVEDPGYRNGRRTLRLHGAELAALPVSGDGLDVAAVSAARTRLDAVVVTPSHQYPLGGRLPVADRLALLDWAARTGGFVVEDDYDSEFRHAGPPLPALASLDGVGAGSGSGSGSGSERVVLIGSFSKVLTPWLRLGYLVLPRHPHLRSALTTARADLTTPVAGPEQLAMTHLITSGALRRHIAATSREYRHRRQLVLAALAPLDERGARLRALDGGLHAVLEVPGVDREHELVARLTAEGIVVAPLSTYSASSGAHPAVARSDSFRPAAEPARTGLVIGYAGVGDLALTTALDRVAALARGILDTGDPP